MPRTKDTQLRAIYEKFNKFRKIQEESNILSEQMNPREKRQLEASFRAIETNIDYIKSETLANSIELKQELNKGLEIEFDEIKTKIFIIKDWSYGKG